jgi:hypothetical protein
MDHNNNKMKSATLPELTYFLSFLAFFLGSISYVEKTSTSLNKWSYVFIKPNDKYTDEQST